MFLREIESKGAKYLYIVKSYRENKKIKQKTIASLGRIDDDLNGEQLLAIGKKLIKYFDKNKTILDVSTSEERDRKRWGGVKAFRKIWDMFDLSKILGKLLKGRKIKFDFFSTVFLMLLDRLLDPKSKLMSYQEQDRYFGIKRNELHHLYRALDLLAENKEAIELELFQKNVSLFNMEVDVVLYDVTTLYFESIGRDVLKEFGFSKDCKINNVQVLLSLLLDLDGRPVGFDIFPGNTFEGHTLKDALEKVKHRFNIHRLVVIGDQQMLSKKNIEIIKDLGYEYIVGGKIKLKSKRVTDMILDIDKYVELATADKEILKYRTIQQEGHNLICTWSSRRARRDQKCRERLLEKAEKMLDKGTANNLSKKGARRYIHFENTGTPTLDKAKIEADAQWDGFFGVQSNAKTFSDHKILDYYHELWKIEEAFRIFKSHLETRPMFHWTAKRILGHMVLCFIAFLMERTLELELRKNNIEYSPSKIRKALDELQFTVETIEDQTFYLRSNITGLSNDILKVLKVQIPPKMTNNISYYKM